MITLFLILYLFNLIYSKDIEWQNCDDILAFVVDDISQHSDIIAVEPIEWNNCDNVSLTFIVEDMSISPYPVKPGVETIIKSVGWQSAPITGGDWTARIYYKGMPFQTTTGPVCGLAPDCPCPCEAHGENITTVIREQANKWALSGRYKGTFRSTDENGKMISCVDFSFDIQR